jgi:single-stranded-DNA-specific exonuclease
MMSQRALWRLAEVPEPEVRRLAAQCGLRMPATRALWNRGLRDAHSVEHFLNPRLTDLPDPFLLRGMDRAVERIRRAIANKERILLYGDYDVDGTASVVILKKTFELFGHGAGFFIPDRLKDGYGMQAPAVEQAARSGVTLIVSVDTGIRAVEAATAAHMCGIDLVITDHHLPEESLPPAFAVINPNQPGCEYPNKNLCGAGVTFKLIQALMYRADWPSEKIVRFSDSFLILVALATVADVVPLTGENRAIVKRGLAGLCKTRNPGLRALLRTAGFEPGEALSATDVAFRVSPRINAAGRMSNARDVIDLFLTADEGRASQIANELHALNDERRLTEENILQEARKQYDPETEAEPRAGLVFSAPGWHRGVLGITANRLVELFNRPVLVLSEDPDTGIAQGSGRSIQNFHLLGALESMPELFTRFGGHKHAVGLTLPLDRLAELRERFNQFAKSALSPDDFLPAYGIDAEVGIEEINDGSVDEVLRLAPFGLGNPAPLFAIRNAEVRQEPAVMKEKHLRLRLHSGTATLFAKAWSFSERIDEVRPGSSIDAIVRFRHDNYSRSRGYSPWSADLVDVRPAVPGA